MEIRMDIGKLTLEQKIMQTEVALMEKGKKLKYIPGAVFFFGQIITEADASGLDELRGYGHGGAYFVFRI